RFRPNHAPFAKKEASSRVGRWGAGYSLLRWWFENMTCERWTVMRDANCAKEGTGLEATHSSRAARPSRVIGESTPSLWNCDVARPFRTARRGCRRVTARFDLPRRLASERAPEFPRNLSIRRDLNAVALSAGRYQRITV